MLIWIIAFFMQFVCQAAQEWVQANLNSGCKLAKVEVLLNCKFPPSKWWKLNTDVCRKGEEGNIGVGGLIKKF